MIFLIFMVLSRVLSEELNGAPTEAWLKKNYERLVRPNVEGGPIDIETYIHVNNIGRISEITMTYDIDIYLRETWYDNRLAQSNTTNETIRYSLHESLSDRLWLPDTFLPQALMHEETQTNSKSVTHRSLIRLWSDGRLLLSRRFSLTVHCPMDLTLYPFDRQVCRLSIESYGHEINHLLYHWKDIDSVTINPEMELPDFILAEVVTKRRNITLSTGLYSRLECCFAFQRRIGFYFIVLFFPATGIVVISWVSLAMSKDNTFSDIIQVILAIIFLNFSHNAVMPKVSYIKAIDVFIQTCFLIVFLSLIKIGIEKQMEERKLSKLNSQCRDSANTKEDAVHAYSPMKKFRHNISEFFDVRCYFCAPIMRKFCSYLFPICFTIFSITYFIAYFVLSKMKSASKCDFN